MITFRLNYIPNRLHGRSLKIRPGDLKFSRVWASTSPCRETPARGPRQNCPVSFWTEISRNFERRHRRNLNRPRKVAKLPRPSRPIRRKGLHGGLPSTRLGSRQFRSARHLFAVHRTVCSKFHASEPPSLGPGPRRCTLASSSCRTTSSRPFSRPTDGGVGTQHQVLRIHPTGLPAYPTSIAHHRTPKDPPCYIVLERASHHLSCCRSFLVCAGSEYGQGDRCAALGGCEHEHAHAQILCGVYCDVETSHACVECERLQSA